MRLAACEIVETGVARVLVMHDSDDPKRQGVKQEVADVLMARARTLSPGGVIYLAWTKGAKEDDLLIQDSEDGTVMIPKPPKLRIESLRESGDRIVALEDAVSDLRAQVEALKAGND